MDELDRNIIGLLSADARMSVATLARRMKVARSTVQARLERLETTGVIAGYTFSLTVMTGARPQAPRQETVSTVNRRSSVVTFFA